MNEEEEPADTEYYDILVKKDHPIKDWGFVRQKCLRPMENFRIFNPSYRIKN